MNTARLESRQEYNLYKEYVGFFSFIEFIGHTIYPGNNMCQKCGRKSGNGLDWLCCLAGNSQTVPTIFFQIFRICFFKDFIKNPQTTIALTFMV